MRSMVKLRGPGRALTPAVLVLAIGLVATGCPPRDIPPNPDLDKWNKDAKCKRSNNCYNYATDLKTDTFAQPGNEGGDPISPITCAEAKQSAKSDGLKDADGMGMCPADHIRTALVVDPGTDYHWYRQNADGTWSHKPGQTCATTKDNAGDPITDPATADRDGYTDFCGYMCVPLTVTTIKTLEVAEVKGAEPLVQVAIVRRSGVANPGWTLTDPLEYDTLAAYLEDLVPVANPNWPELLGYRGFAILRQDDALPIANIVRVWNGVIEFHEGETMSFFADGNGLEAFLTSEAIARGLGSELP
ncbi:MAG: hypothetical protein KC466_04795 [Myxococcales bacterium]|nr:hypothetical protein [Myxococcales bacterium]